MAWRGYDLTDPPRQDDPALDRRDPNWHAIALIREKLARKYQWARDAGVTEGNTYDATTATAIAEFQQRAGIPQVLDENGYGIADFRTRARLGSYPPPPAPRHACLTFSGTWAPPGVGYPSDVAQICSDVIEEIPVHAPWSFGPIPPDAPTAPSYRQSVQIGYDWACDWIESNPQRTFLLGGYSQGAEAASRVYAELLPGGRLRRYRDNYVAAYMLGNPSRAPGHTYYGGPHDNGLSGISTFNLKPGDVSDDFLDCTQPGDIYTNTPKPGNPTGDIMRTAYELGIDIQLNDFWQFAGGFLTHVQALADKAMTNIPAAFDAAARTLKFVADNPPTRPHITYEWAEVWPGQTYLGLCVQHVRDWSLRRQVLGVAA